MMLCNAEWYQDHASKKRESNAKSPCAHAINKARRSLSISHFPFFSTHCHLPYAMIPPPQAATGSTGAAAAAANTSSAVRLTMPPVTGRLVHFSR
jgi:hypothetical protein